MSWLSRIVAGFAGILLTGVGRVEAGPPRVVYEPVGAANGKHVVLLSGDEEYRSEEAMPMLAEVLSRQGFRCTVLYSVDPDGTINPNNTASLSNPEAIGSADLLVMQLRFRKWPDEAMEQFEKAFLAGTPVVALRTSTHAFQFDGGSRWAWYNRFGKEVLGEEWVSHWGSHKAEATRGVIEESAKGDPVLRGVSDIFGDTDVYEASPPDDARILVRGQVLKGMSPADPPASYEKKRADGGRQDVNSPMMPVAWTREYRNREGKVNRIFCTTMGAATDLANEGLRRLVVNAVHAGLGLEVPEKADVSLPEGWKPTPYGFGGFVKGVKPVPAK